MMLQYIQREVIETTPDCVSLHNAWSDLGVGRVKRGHPFFCEITYDCQRTLSKITSIYIRASVPAAPFWILRSAPERVPESDFSNLELGGVYSWSGLSKNLLGKAITFVMESNQKTSNGPFYNCYSWKRGRSGPCLTQPFLLYYVHQVILTLTIFC